MNPRGAGAGDTAPAGEALQVGVLALQGDVAEHADMLRAVGAEPRLVRLPRHLEDLDGLILPGGESTTMGKLLVSFDLLDPLRVLARHGLPMYGTCAGMILLANTVTRGYAQQPTIGGMDIEVERNAFGRQAESFESEIDLSGQVGEGGPFPGVFIRAPIICSVGPRVDVLGELDDGTAVAAQQGNMLATSFHPELTQDTRMHEYFLDIVRGRKQLNSLDEQELGVINAQTPEVVR